MRLVAFSPIWRFSAADLTAEIDEMLGRDGEALVFEAGSPRAATPGHTPPARAPAPAPARARAPAPAPAPRKKVHGAVAAAQRAKAAPAVVAGKQAADGGKTAQLHAKVAQKFQARGSSDPHLAQT